MTDTDVTHVHEPSYWSRRVKSVFYLNLALTEKNPVNCKSN